MILSENVFDEKIFLFFALLGNSIPHLVRLSGRGRTVPNEKGLDGLYCGGKIPRTKTVLSRRPESLKEKLSSGVWKNRSLSLHSRKHVEEILMWKDTLLVIFQEVCLIS
jgi:hypothetical protein